MKTQNIAQKIGLACAIGAFIGGIITRQINPYFWWLGMIAGFVIGYLAYEFKKVPGAVKTAAQAVYDYDWKGVDWTSTILSWYCIVLLFATALLATCWVAQTSTAPTQETIMTCAMTFMVTFFATVGGFATIKQNTELSNPVIDVIEYGGDKKEVIIAFVLATLGCNFAGMVILAIVALAWAVLRFIWFIARKLPKFSWHVFKLIHSEARLICGVDAAIGIAVGYILDPSTSGIALGAIIGAVCGVLNYWIVSIKILKLEPKI